MYDERAENIGVSDGGENDTKRRRLENLELPHALDEVEPLELSVMIRGPDAALCSGLEAALEEGTEAVARFWADYLDAAVGVEYKDETDPFTGKRNRCCYLQRYPRQEPLAAEALYYFRTCSDADQDAELRKRMFLEMYAMRRRNGYPMSEPEGQCENPTVVPYDYRLWRGWPMSEAGSQRWQIECAVLEDVFLKMLSPSVFNGDFSVLYARWRSAGFFYVDELEAASPASGCVGGREIYIENYMEDELHDEWLGEFRPTRSGELIARSSV